MKILLLITKAEIGGAQAFVLNLAKGLKAAEDDISVAAGLGDYLPEELKKANIPFYRLNNLKRSQNPLTNWLFSRELKKLIDQEGFELIHLNSSNALAGALAARWSKKKPRVIFTVHGLSVLDPKYPAPGLLKVIYRFYFKFFLRYVNKTVFVSRYDFREGEKQGISARGIVIYNGLDFGPDYFLSPTVARLEIAKLINRDLGESYLLGSIGRLAPQKNYDFLIRLWPEIKKIKPTAKLIIIGEGPSRQKYEELITSLNLKEDIYLPGELKDASRLLKAFDLFVLPSLHEGLSISLIEAVLGGVPVLASEVGGNSEVIGETNCFVLNDTAAFLSHFTRPDKSKTEAVSFSASTMVKEYQKIYEF